MIDEILIRRKNKIILDGTFTENESNTPYVATINKNIEQLGYSFSEELFRLLCEKDVMELKEFYKELVPILKSIRGADVEYNPMYPNFPDQVMEMDKVDLYVNALLHYLSHGELYPLTKKEERLPLFDKGNVTILDVGYEDDLREIFNNLLGSKTSLSETDKNDVRWFFENTTALDCLPPAIPLKETVALVVPYIMELDSEYDIVYTLSTYVKTPTDVLRLATSLSGGDVSLKENTKYKSFSHKERRVIMELLRKMPHPEEDMARYKAKWIRVGERLHPGEFSKKRYKDVCNAFKALRNGDKIKTFNGRVESAIRSNDYETALNYLLIRPGELARRLDHLLRISPDPVKNNIINSFKAVATDISSTVLWQVMQHFKQRDMEYRVFFPKGGTAKSFNIKNELPELEPKYCKAVVSVCENALMELYKQKDFMGNVYLADEYKNYVIPFSQRSASKAAKTVTRGSRFPINPEAKVIRGFIWWTNSEDERVDIDLSAAFMDENFDYLSHVSYTSLTDIEYGSYHSGDIIDGGPIDGRGVSEFLDVNINTALTAGARYVIFQVYAFTRTPFCKLPHVMFGWMEREKVDSGETFEPKTVVQKMDLVSDSCSCIPVIFDLKERQVIWADMANDKCDISYSPKNLENSLSVINATCYAITQINRPTLYDLIDLHIRSHGVRTDSKEDADIIFDVDDGVTPYDLDVFMGEYL